MKREEDTNIVENLIEHLEAVLQKAKVLFILISIYFIQN